MADTSKPVADLSELILAVNEIRDAIRNIVATDVDPTDEPFRCEGYARCSRCAGCSRCVRCFRCEGCFRCTRCEGCFRCLRCGTR